MAQVYPSAIDQDKLATEGQMMFCCWSQKNILYRKNKTYSLQEVTFKKTTWQQQKLP